MRAHARRASLAVLPRVPTASHLRHPTYCMNSEVDPEGCQALMISLECDFQSRNTANHESRTGEIRPHLGGARCQIFRTETVDRRASVDRHTATAVTDTSLREMRARRELPEYPLLGREHLKN